MSWKLDPSRELAGLPGELDGLGAELRGAFRSPRLLARWALTIAVCYTILYTPTANVSWQFRQLFVAAALGVALVGTRSLLRDSRNERIGHWILLLDVATVSVGIALLQNATSQFFLTYFLVLVMAAFATSARVAAIYSVLIAGIYGGLLFGELGPPLFQNWDLLLRIAFLFGMGLMFGLLADESQLQRSRASLMASKMDAVANHARSLARDKYRMRALSEIGRLGLTSSSVASNGVLFEISRRIQRGVGVDRVSLIVLADGEERGYVAASSDDDRVEVRPIDITEYPELQETISHGKIVEVHPGRPAELWARIQEHLPEAYEFKTFLVVPIKTDEQVFGAFFLRDKDPKRNFDDEERSFCWAAALMTASFIRGRDLLEQLRAQSRVDGLTGLLNFQAFTDELTRKLESKRARAIAPYTLVVLDMDNLKAINDEHGHMAGNRAIIELGERLRKALPEAVVMCRYGGDEFVALVHAGQPDTIDRLNVLLNTLTTLEWDEEFDLRTSIGVAEFPAHGESPEALIEAADQAMYLAKGKGGHRIRAARGEETDQQEVYDAVVAVQTKRKVPKVQERFDESLQALQRHSILGLRSPLVHRSISALAQAVEGVDPHSRAHSRHVARLCRALCRELGIEDDDALKIETAGYLHDVGKINLPAEVLTKEGELTPGERGLIEEAPAHAATLLESLPGLKQVANLVRTYQERWDGSGYPAGLEGKEIPVGAQIVGICDVYSALTASRAQRPALSEEKARRTIEPEIGSKWNPVVGRAFMKLLASGASAAVAGDESADDPQGFATRDDRRQTA